MINTSNILESVRKWLQAWHLDRIKRFIEVTHAFGLNDTLLIKAAESSLSLEEVSLYTNKFDGVVAKTAFRKGLQRLKLSSTSPEFTSEGSF